MSTLEILLAEKACRDLVVAAATAVDGQDYEGLVQLFSIDASLTRPDGTLLRGRQAIFDAYVSRSSERLTQHLICNHVVHLTSPGHAESHCMILLWSGQRSATLTGKGRLADPQEQLGEIDDQLVLSPEGWRIQSRQARFTFYKDKVLAT